jgi:MFS family permease
MGGAFVAAALGLALLALGAGFGLSIVSPWATLDATASSVSTTAIAWLIATQLIASALGGYLVGRLRTKWSAVHTDEVYFRDTANGFLAWAVALVICASLLASAATSMISSSLANPQPVASAADSTGPDAYYVDTLFRSETVTPGPVTAAPPEAGRIFVKALTQGEMGIADRQYLGRIVSARTGLAPADAEKRIDTVIADARQATDTVRRLTARLLLWMFLALLIGAFSASYAATVGGRHRDHLKVID